MQILPSDIPEPRIPDQEDENAAYEIQMRNWRKAFQMTFGFAPDNEDPPF